MNNNEHQKTKSNQKPSKCKMCGASLADRLGAGRSPFCSERCRLNDLSKWFGENYRIASHPVQSGDPEEEDNQDIDTK